MPSFSDHFQFHTTNHAPYYIVSPNFIQKSAGPRTLHYLCHTLNELGYEAYITSEICNPWLRTPKLTQEIKETHKKTNRTPIVIYPEIVHGNPLDEVIVVRWLLNKAGLLGGSNTHTPNELIFHWDEWVLSGEETQGRLFLPNVDERIFNSEGVIDSERLGFCYYAHKYLLSGGKISERITKNGISLCQNIPYSPEEIANVLRSTKVLYCYEPSNIIHEAHACGCSIVLIESDYLDNFDIKSSEIPLTKESALDFSFIPPLKTPYKEFIAEYSKKSRNSILKFIEITQAKAGHHKKLPQRLKQRDKRIATELYKKENKVNNKITLSEWLSSRKFNPTQLNLALTKIKTSDINIGVLIYAEKNKSPEVLKTLKNIATIDIAYRPKFIAVLGLEQPIENHGDILFLSSLKDLILNLPQENNQNSHKFIAFTNAGDIFTPTGMLTTILALQANPNCRAAYADSILTISSSQLGCLAKPDFNLDATISLPSIFCGNLIFHSSIFWDYIENHNNTNYPIGLDLLLQFISTNDFDGFLHINEPLFITSPPKLQASENEISVVLNHLHARGYKNATIDSTLPGRYRIRYGHPTQPLVSIIIPTKDQFPLLERCVTSLLEKTTYPHFEILLVDNASTDPAACAWLDGLAGMGDARIRVLRYPGPFNFADINNFAVREAQGEYLVLLNNDTAIIHGDWLDALLNHAQRPEVGMVGAKLLTPQGTIEHAGYLLGVQGAVASAFAGLNASEPGYMHRLEIDQNYSAVSAACMMVRRSLYEELGGMDAQEFPHLWADVDLCLRARGAGYLTVWTPHATLLHEGGASRANLSAEENTQQTEKAQDALYRHWLPVLARDPASNRNVSLQSTSFEVETDASLNWNPLIWRPVPTVLAVHADAYGCGHYRIIHPGHGMTQAGIADVRVRGDHIPLIEIERLQPDSWVLQRQVTDVQYEFIQRTSKLSRAFKVGELDDYLPNLPMKSAHRSHMPKDILRAMRRWLSAMDRFVVSTEPLAEALGALHRDIRVVHNRLPPERWRGLKSLRQQGRRPRVGWAGGVGHQGDLELIADVVKALAGEVDWVFFGMCPEHMRKYVHEFHGPTSFEKYPKRLANLDLDLALAPLEYNLFNDCKSNLRLLEYGACGFPVVCTDALPYRCDLPVTRVKNRYKDWVDAIRMHTNDLNATAAAGDALRAAVLKDWMLEGEHLEHWLKAWLPD